MNLCNVCKKVQATITCPCGKYIYCSPNCIADSEHIKICDFQKMDYQLCISVMHTFVPIIETVKEDKELHEAAKGFMKLLIEKLNKYSI